MNIAIEILHGNVFWPKTTWAIGTSISSALLALKVLAQGILVQVLIVQALIVIVQVFIFIVQPLFGSQ